jgi:5'-nucleotidase
LNPDHQILVTNDDGIQSPGLEALAQAVSRLGPVLIAAPEREMSATSHRITLNEALKTRQLGPDRFAVEGTPADCVIIAALRLVRKRPALVVSGVNRGSNIGDDVHYSGTVAAAFEAALQGIPAIAVSAFSETGRPQFQPAATFAAHVAERVLHYGLPPGVILNINFPERWNGKAQLTRQGRRAGHTLMVEESNTRGASFFWLHEELHQDDPSIPADSWNDFEAIANGYASISPLRLDRTAYRYFERFGEWLKGLGGIAEGNKAP